MARGFSFWKAEPLTAGVPGFNQGMADVVQITAKDLADMATHWLGTPPGAYLGSDYGAPIEDILMSPQSSGVADDLISKFRQDVPLAVMAPPEDVNLYAYSSGTDQKVIVLNILGNDIPITGAA